MYLEQQRKLASHVRAFLREKYNLDLPSIVIDQPPDVQMGEAIAWAMVSGTFVALARMLAQRRAADYYRRSAGHLPPQLQKD